MTSSTSRIVREELCEHGELGQHQVRPRTNVMSGVICVGSRTVLDFDEMVERAAKAIDPLIYENVDATSWVMVTDVARAAVAEALGVTKEGTR